MKKKFTKEDLLPFCADPENELLRKWMQEPWVNEKTGDVWASEGHYSLILKRSLVSGRLRKYHYGNNVNIPQADMHATIEFSDIDAAYDKAEKYPEAITVPTGKIIECEDCNGTGEVTWEYEDLDGYTHDLIDTCPVCDGDGTVVEKTVKLTGKMLVKPDQLFKLHNTFFNIDNMMRVVDGLKKLGFTKFVRLNEGLCEASLFEVAEGVTLLLMPIIGDGNTARKIISIKISKEQ